MWASYEDEHGSTTYHETQKTVEIPIYKKYAIPIPHPVPVAVPQQIKVPIPQPYQVQVRLFLNHYSQSQNSYKFFIVNIKLVLSRNNQ